MNDRAEALRGHGAMLLFSALVAGSFALGSRAADQISPAAINAARFLIAGAIIGALAFALGHLKRSAFVAPWRYVVLGALFGTYFVMMFEGLKTADPISTAAVFTLMPLMSAAFALPLLGQKITRGVALALTLGGLGALWVIFRGDIGALSRFDLGRGEAIYFIGCIFHALYTPMLRKLNRGEPALAYTFGTILAALVLISLWGARDLVSTDWAALPAIVWITLFYVAIAASALTFILLQYGSLRIPASKAMAYTYLTPSWVIGWEFALGGGLPAWTILPGIGLTILALVLLLAPDQS